MLNPDLISEIAGSWSVSAKGLEKFGITFFEFGMAFVQKQVLSESVPEFWHKET